MCKTEEVRVGGLADLRGLVKILSGFDFVLVSVGTTERFSVERPRSGFHFVRYSTAPPMVITLSFSRNYR